MILLTELLSSSHYRLMSF